MTPVLAIGARQMYFSESGKGNSEIAIRGFGDSLCAPQQHVLSIEHSDDWLSILMAG
jgi:hypothetical protein